MVNSEIGESLNAHRLHIGCTPDAHRMQN